MLGANHAWQRLYGLCAELVFDRTRDAKHALTVVLRVHQSDRLHSSDRFKRKPGLLARLLGFAFVPNSLLNAIIENRLNGGDFVFCLFASELSLSSVLPGLQQSLVALVDDASTLFFFEPDYCFDLSTCLLL